MGAIGATAFIVALLSVGLVVGNINSTNLYEAKITESKPIEISGSVYVCQKAEVRVGK